MNQTEVIELAKTLGDHAAPQLRTYVYVEWVCWLAFLIAGLIAMGAVWKYRAKLNTVLDEDLHIGWVATIAVTLVVGTSMILFIPYSLHVFTTPELEAIKAILGVRQ